MSRAPTTQDISWFLDLHKKKQLNLDPPYQRRSVWSPRDKRFFIDTILNGYPAPPVFLHKTLDDEGNTTYHVVDGKQRLQTIIDFTENKVYIPDDFSDIKLQKKRWKDLEGVTRKKFWDYCLIAEMLPDVSDAAIRNIFERINRNSRKLTAQEMRHARYEGWFIRFVEAEAEKEEWKEFGVVTLARIKRMADVQFISELCAVVLNGDINDFSQDSLDNLYAEYEDITELGTFVEDDFVAEIARIKTAMSEMLQTEPELKNYFKTQAHFYSLWAHLHLEGKCETDTPALARHYQTFMIAVEKVDPLQSLATEQGALNQTAIDQQATIYATNMRGASTDLMPRKKRHEGLTAGINELRRNS